MLVLTRRPGESIRIGDDIELHVVAAGTGKVRLGVVAPRSVRVDRREVYARRQAEARATSAGPPQDAPAASR
jgi:carbon storage regulator